MELAFQKTQYPCLKQVKRDVQKQEQTQELRLDDEMPDIGSVLGTWGQVLLRGKEWHRGQMCISAGVMAHILYLPEGGGAPQHVECWIPMQMSWDLPDTDYEGTILAFPLLYSADARSISARRLLVRVTVGMQMEAAVPGALTVCVAENLPEDVQCLKTSYPMELPAEMGERPFSLEEELTIPGGMSKPVKWVYYTLQPQILEHRVMAGKMVFRGIARVHVLYLGEDGGLYNIDQEIPFSHYAELSRDYDQDATAWVAPAVTSLEIETDEEGNHLLKADITSQYVIYNRPVVEMVEDAYSLTREVELEKETVSAEPILDRSAQTLNALQTVQLPVRRVVDISFMPEHGFVEKKEEAANVVIPGSYELLYLDEEDRLQSVTAKWEESWDLPAASDVKIMTCVQPCSVPQATMMGDSVTLRGEVCVEGVCCAKQGMEMVSALSLGQEIVPDPDRPSLILCRSGKESLWSLAKKNKTTPEAICRANSVESIPQDNRILLIPIP